MNIFELYIPDHIMAKYTMTVVFPKQYLHSLNGPPEEACCSSWRILSEEVAPNQYFVAVFLGTLDGSCSFGVALLPKDIKHFVIKPYFEHSRHG